MPVATASRSDRWPPDRQRPPQTNDDNRTRMHYVVHKEAQMNASTTMTIRVPVALKEKLGVLARGTRRSKSFLAAEAVSAYVERELEIIEGIERGLDDVAAGRVVPHDEVTAEARAIVADAKRAAE